MVSNNKQIISPKQLLAMIILFEFGTALIVPIGLVAEQGVWLSILLAMPGGIILFLVFVYLFREYPNMIPSGYMRKILGKYISFPLSLLYVLFFIYISARNLRESGDLLISASYDQTPIFVVQFVMISAVIYVLSKGIEVFFRLGQIYLFIMIGLGIIGNFAVLFSGVIDPKNLFPLLGEGWGAVIRAAYPSIFAFPFAELFCFTAVLPYLNQKKFAAKSGVAGIVIGGIILTFTHAINISVLGANIYSRSTFSLFTTISLVSIGDFLQRLDAIVMLTLIIGVFFKMSIYCYAAVAFSSDIFKVSKQRKLVYPIAVIILFTSILSAESFPEHGEEGLTSIYIIVLLFAVIPIVLAMIHWVRKRFKERGR
jgi:spore germination protein KB